MKESYMTLLVCPECKDELHLKVNAVEQGEVKDGILTCKSCHCVYAIRDFVPRFIKPLKPRTGKMNPIRTQMDKFYRTIVRQRVAPRLWDYSYFMLANNLRVFRQFRTLLLKERQRRILDVGCGFKPWTALFDANKVAYIGVDFDKEKSAADFIAHADKLPFPDNDFDALIYSEVLEHAVNLPGVLSEMRRVAKPGALVYISSPFVFPEHGIPHDFQRLSRYFYQRAFEKDEIIVLKESNSSLATAFASFNMVGEWTPFAAITGIKQFVYSIFNILGLAGDFVVGLLLKIAGEKFMPQFYGMPMGYALVVRIRK